MVDITQQSKASLFPCDCGLEGIVVVVQDEDDDTNVVGAPLIKMAFFGVGSYADGRLSWRNRLRWIWRIIHTGNPFEDMVTLRSNVARNMANHILYLLSRNKIKQPEQDYLVKLPGEVKTPDELPESFGTINQQKHWFNDDNVDAGM